MATERRSTDPGPHARVALVTSGHKRIGRAIALHLAVQGWDLAIHYRQDAPLADEVLDFAWKSGRKAVCFQAELTDPEAVQAMVEAVTAAFGRLDLVVAAAAGYVATPLATLTAATLDRILAENARAPVDLVLRCAGLLRASGDGRAIVLGDLAAVTPFAGYLAHSMAKAALHAGIRGLAAELAPAIVVNGIVPGAVLQPEVEDDTVWAALQRRVPMGQLALTDPDVSVAGIVDAVQYLATCSRYVSGSLVVVDGGRTARW